jgi:hypothetical protein
LRPVVERPPDVLNALGDAVVGDENPGPYDLHDLVAADDTAGVIQKMAQKYEGFAAKYALRAVYQQCANIWMKNEAVKPVG